MTTRIIIVEDDPDLRELLQESLSLNGFEVRCAGSALEFYQTLAMGSFDIAIIDIGLPDLSGLDIAAQLRSRMSIGIIVLTALNAVEDRVQGFEAGADLYFSKPVNCRELIAAIGNLARRIQSAAESSGAAPGAWGLDRVSWSLHSPDDKEIPLTSAEMRLVETLLEVAGTTVPHRRLYDALGYGEVEGRANLEALVRRLRRKIEFSTGVRAPIRTVHGQGYLFSAPVQLRQK